MGLVVRVVIALVVALVVAFGWRAYDEAHGAEWEVSPAQVQAAQANGQQGVESTPGTVTVLPIRSETADILPFKWAAGGLVAGGLALVALARVGRQV